MPDSANLKSSLDAPAALGLLINLSGKMRMLSHRIAMFILSTRLHPDAEGQDERLRGALDEFRQIHATLKNGNPDWGVAAPVIEMISDGDALGPQFHAIIESFIGRTEAMMKSEEAEGANAFVEFVAGPCSIDSTRSPAISATRWTSCMNASGSKWPPMPLQCTTHSPPSRKSASTFAS